VTNNKELFHLCGPCNVGRHDICITLIDPSDPTKPRCTCAAEGHTHTIDPIDGEPALTGHLRRDVVSRNRGGVRDVDYDSEPFETRTNNETGATKSKPRDDAEIDRYNKRKHDERADWRLHRQSTISPF
jgi:hypothetical protein